MNVTSKQSVILPSSKLGLVQADLSRLIRKLTYLWFSPWCLADWEDGSGKKVIRFNGEIEQCSPLSWTERAAPDRVKLVSAWGDGYKLTAARDQAAILHDARDRLVPFERTVSVYGCSEAQLAGVGL